VLIRLVACLLHDELRRRTVTTLASTMTDAFRRSRRGCAFALVVFTCAGLAACGGSSEKSVSSTSTASGGAGSGGSAPKPIASADAGLATGTGPQQFRISIYDLRRAGPFVVLDFGIACQTPSSGCGTTGSFSPSGGAQGPVARNGAQDEYEPSGVSLVDPVGEKVYYPVRDADGRPFTTHFSGFTISDALTHLEWVRYAAPPASADSLDVVFPDGGPQFAHVPVSSGSGPSVGGQVTADAPAAFSQPPTSTNTSGLTLPVANLVATIGNQSGSDTESPTEANLTLRSDVLFHFDKANLTPAARSIIASVAAQIKARARGTVRVTGYTDSIGSNAVNIPLSFARAHAVVSALRPLTAGVGYIATGDGSANPVAPNTKPGGSDNPAGRALNRRVTIAFAVKAPAKPALLPQPAGSQTSGPQASTGGTATFTVPNSSTYQVSASSLFRDGNLLALRMSIRCLHGAGSPPGNTCNTEADLGGTDTAPPQLLVGDHADFFTVSGFYLEDPSTGAIYVPLRDSYANALTGNIDTSLTPINNVYDVWAYFPLPPASVSSLTVVAPQDSAAVASVPIASSPPAG
jgi:outer membrane protein OmpA-like peptidoglycan-associated protein